MKKILHINVTYKTASTGRIISDILAATENYEFDYKILFQNGNNQDAISYRYENKLENFIRRGTHKLFGNLEFVTVTQTIKLIRQIRIYNPDLIHIHTIHHQCLNYKMLYSFLKKIDKPIIFSMHDCWLYTGGCYHYTIRGCRGFLDGCNNCPANRHRLDCLPSHTHSNLLRKSDFYNSSDNIYFVTVSDWLLDQVKNSILANKHIKRIHNGIDVNVFNKKKDDLIIRRSLLSNRKNIVVAVASYWSDNKGINEIIALAEILGEEYQFVLVGEKGQVVVSQPNVMMYGSTSDSSELADIYIAADVFVNLSLEETFGLVTIEAACCGTPVIAYDSTANSEVIGLVGGRLIKDPGDVFKMADGIRDICCNKLKNQVDVNKITEYFNRTRMSTEYVNLYSKMLEEKGENDED